jgi:hypothetical protein
MVQNMRGLRTRRFSGAVGLGVGLGLLLASACSASNKSGTSNVRGSSGTTSSGSSSSGGTGTGVGNSSGDGTGNIITGNSGGVPNNDAGCQQYAVNFVPKIPTVFVLVDRSGSMFTAAAGGVAPWEPLKMGALQVIQELQAEVAFGWGAFTGLAGVTCPDFKSVAPALNNYTAIDGVYGTMEATGYKSETPVGEALPLAQALLASSPVDGDKYILFVTDGEPDFCDDGDANCPIDDVVYHLQSLKTQGISTIIFGLQNGGVPVGTLQAFANAGAGQPVATTTFADTTQNIFYACQGVTGWKADATAAGQTGMNLLGTYAATGGMAKYYQPDPSDQDALTTQLRSVLAGVKSCTFDLGGKITVDTTQLNLASVAIQGQPIPLDPTNGWSMATSTQLTLAGTACDTWRQPTSTTIDFNFPCEIIIPK